MPVERSSPYIWVTWLTKLLVGENSCEWGAWFRAHFQNYDVTPGTFDSTGWQLKHTNLLNRIRAQLEAQGKTVFTENQNKFVLRGQSATLGGKPDLIAISGSAGTVFDVKTGAPSPSHHVQVMVYMYAAPRALGQYRGVTFDGKVVYEGQEVPIPSLAVDDAFVRNLVELIGRLAGPTPARKAPSLMECGFCNLTTANCPERVADAVVQDGETGDF
ncbi:MAG: PD-(D/E)XK nuclease family protein [Dehalococcoidia bacterium]|nr:PD-(D/E)XK nuclease family protein [Dehalococcoidia bacterium]